MLQLDETVQSTEARESPGYEVDFGKDVGAATVTSVGHEMLKKQVRLQMSQTPPPEVSWGRLVAMLAALAAIIVAAVWMQQ